MIIHSINIRKLINEFERRSVGHTANLLLVFTHKIGIFKYFKLIVYNYD